MKRTFFILILLTVFAAASLSAMPLNRGSDDLNKAFLEAADREDFLPVIIVMEEQYDSELLYDSVKGLDRVTRREYTINTLQRFSERTQAEIRTVLADMEKDGLVDNIRALWISNVISLNATKEALLILDRRDDINRLGYDPFRKVLIDNDQYSHLAGNQETIDGNREERDMAYNLNTMNVPAVWDQGFLGAGTVVAVLDSGVNYNHHDLANRMWIHPEYPNHGYNFVNNNHQTMDFHGHGTHCAGTVAGDGTSGIQTGVAPESSIMALLVLDSSGSGQQSGVWAAIQFSVQYAADVMSISLGWLHAWNPDRPTFRSTMNNALSAGLIASVAAGNEGNQQFLYPVPSNVRTPGDCPPPWLHPDQTLTGGVSAVMSVGATNSADQIANFSSRGPVSWVNEGFFNDYPYNPGMGLIRPDIVAPGVDVISLRHNNNTGYVSMSGTSMAAPNNAGVIALMYSKDHTLTPEEISQIIEETAVPLSTSKSNTFGSGRVDALAAINVVTADSPPNPAIHPNPSDGENNVSLYPTLSWANGGGALMYYLSVGTDNPPTNIIQEYLSEDRFFEFMEQLEHSTTHYWRVDAVNDNGTTEGEVWSFTTGLPVSEDFETGDFSSYEWMFSTTGEDAQDWHISSEEAFSGFYSAQSGQISSGSITTLYITLDVVEEGVISFYRKVSTAEGQDFLRFFINNNVVDYWSGQEDWGEVSYNVTPGTYTFRWVYMRFSPPSSDQNAVWVDDITFPPLLVPLTAPEALGHDIGLDTIHLSWDLPIDEEDDQVTLLGFNIYQAIGQNSSYSLVNTNPIEEEEYYLPITLSGEHNYYVTALYDTGESEPSNIANLTIEPSLEEPAVDPPGGVYDHVVYVTIETEEPDTHVYYTIDDTLPDLNSNLYSEPIRIEAPLTLQIKVYKLGSLPAEVVTHEYEFTTSTGDEEIIEVVTDLRAYPNPFVVNNPNSRSNQELKLDFIVANEQGEVKIDIFNIRGQLIRSFNPQVAAGERATLHWDLQNNDGKQAGSGIYLIRMISAGEVINRKVMVIR